MTIRRVLRSLHIFVVVARHTGPALPGCIRRRSWTPFAQSLCVAFERLGPAFVKVGQFLSLRADLIGMDNARAFERLQDQAAPLDYPLIAAVVERELSAPPHRLFARFDPEPLASASVSQVHRAWLKSGTPVVVKVQRPHAARLLAGDVKLLQAFATMLHRLPFIHRHLDLSGFVAEIERSAAQELDFRKEAEISEKMALQFADMNQLRIPKVYWSFTSRRVLTSEFVDGWKISDPAAQCETGYPELAELGAQLFFRQVLDHGLFHADLHSSNLFVTRTGEIAYVDFGIWGTLDSEERHSVLGALAGLLARDATLALRHLERLGVYVEPERKTAFARDIETVMDHALVAHLSELSMTQVGRGILAAVRRHRVRFPHKYALLIKALLTVEGSARMLHGAFDLEQCVREYLAELFSRQARLGPLVEAGWRASLLAGAGSALFAPEPSQGEPPTA